MKYAMVLVVLVLSFLLQGHPEMIILFSFCCCTHVFLHAFQRYASANEEVKD